ncbi:MAG: arginine--tRNA ligase [Candidatus Omnitrophica bacterium]|nr:arginine--tRNA ligase [Candidatus Omnitrophota bacterium]
MYFEVVNQLNQILMDAASALSPEAKEKASDLSFTPARDPEHGDLAANAAMVLAKTVKKSPRDLADVFVKALSASPLVARAEVAGPGFVNVFLSNDILVESLKRILTDENQFGRSKKYAGKKALVEFVSANPTGPLHVGHVRGAVVGDSTAELLAAVGYEVTREYYYNDAGVQMQMLGRSVQARYRQLFGREAEFPENGYKGDYIRYIAAALKTARGDALLPEESWRPFTEFAADILMTIIMDDLRKLRVRFDATFSERSLHESGEVQRTLDRLKDKKATYEQDDALWLKTTEYGDEKDRVLVKSDGEPTYVTPDIAYHCDKYERQYDKMVNVMGHDHHSQCERVKIALSIFGFDLSCLHYLLNQMVSIERGGEKIKLSTREGQFMTLAEMADELGADVTRYFFAQRSYNTQMIFDWDLAKKQSMDNPVYYLQYVHARACSIEEKARERGIQPAPDLRFDASPLSGDRERLLLLKLFYYPLVVMDAAERLEANLIPSYLEDLAKTFHTYYQVQRVLDQDDPVGTQARFHLVLAVRQVMRNGLGLLNVSAPDRM